MCTYVKINIHRYLSIYIYTYIYIDRVSKSNEDIILPTVGYNIIENEQAEIPVVK
jgi:hypothetical protein